MKRDSIRSLILAAFALLWLGAAPALGLDLDEVIPGLYGGDGITLGNPGHDAHFTASTFEQLQLINEGLAEIPGNLPIGSSAASFTYEFDPVTAVPERKTDESLGPLFAERSRTLGGSLIDGDIRFALAFQYTYLNFTTFEGDNLDSLRLIARHDEVPGDNAFENDVIPLDLDISAEEHVFSFYGTLALTTWLDVSVVVPFVYLNLEAESKASIVDRGGNGIHFFDPDPGRIITVGGRPTDGDVSRNTGSAFGIGDVFVRAKWLFMETFFGGGDSEVPLKEKLELGLLGQVKLATGDDEDLLGTGHTNYRVVLVVSKTFDGWFEPHANFGYEWNGAKARRDAYVWAGGASVKLHDQMTVYADFVGKKKRIGENIGDNLVDVVLGGKFNPFSSMIIT
ncbi:MAG: transporter, partial [Planctomycetota bacterium]